MIIPKEFWGGFGLGVALMFCVSHNVSPVLSGVVMIGSILGAFNPLILIPTAVYICGIASIPRLLVEYVPEDVTNILEILVLTLASALSPRLGIGVIVPLYLAAKAYPHIGDKAIEFTKV